MPVTRGPDGRPVYYVLDGKAAVPASFDRWSMLLNSTERIVAQETVAGIWVSTVFIGLDYRFGEGPPLIFETAVQDDYDWQGQWRYSTWEEAEAGHRAVVEHIKAEAIRIGAASIAGGTNAEQ